MEDFSRKADDTMEKFLRITSTVGNQIQWMNSSIVKMKEGDDRYKQFNEIITNIERQILDMDEKYENRREVIKGEHVDENQGKAVVTGFHSETTESWGFTTLERIDKRSRNGHRKCKNWMPRKDDHTCFHSLQKRWRKKQIHQVSEHVEKKNWEEEK